MLTIQPRIKAGGSFVDCAAKIKRSGVFEELYGTNAELTIWDDTINILAMGQSNMLHRNGGSAPADSRVQIWDRSEGTWKQWNPNNDPVEHRIPDPGFGSGPTSGNYPLAFHAAKWIANEYDVRVNVICVAWGGASIDQITGSSIWTEMLSQLDDGKLYMPRIDAFLWHQGETDSGDSANYFATKFPALISSIRGFPQSHAAMPVIAGELEPNRIEFNDALNNYAAANSNIAIADASDLTTDDGTHFTGPSGITLGTRMGSLFANFHASVNAGAYGSVPSGSISDFAGVAEGNTTINLTWTDVVDASIHAYAIEDDTGAGYVEIGRVAPGTEIYAANNLASGTTHTLRVKALNKYGMLLSNTDSVVLSSGPDLHTNLIEHFTLDETTGVYAGSEAVADLSVNGAIIRGASGIIGVGVNSPTPAGGDYLQAPLTFANENFKGLSGFSVSWWSRYNRGTPDGGKHTIFAVQENTVENPKGVSIFAKYDNDTAAITAAIRLAGEIGLGGDFTHVPEGYTYYHYVLTFDGRYLRLYVNTVQDATVFDNGSSTTMIDVDAIHPLQIFRSPASYNVDPGRVSLDELAFWAEALDQTKVNALYNGGAGIPRSSY